MIIRRRAIKQNNIDAENGPIEPLLDNSAENFIEDFSKENSENNSAPSSKNPAAFETGAKNPAPSEFQQITQENPENKAQPAILPEISPAQKTMETKPAQTPPVPKVLTPEEELQQKLDEVEKIDISSLEFKERFERRRGERRRGYRRIDERTLVSRAQEEAQSIRELAAKEGYKNGIAEATAELENLKNSLIEFLSCKKEAYDALSDDMLELSLEIAKKIIKKEVELSGDVLKGVLSEVFDEISSNEEKITIKVAPDEVDFARASMPEILANSALDAKIVIIADEAVEKGSCVVMASNGVIDANFSTQLAIIQNAFGIYKRGA